MQTGFGVRLSRHAAAAGSWPATAVNSASIVPAAPGAVRSWPAANRWQVSRQTPARGMPAQRAEVGPEVGDPASEHEPLAGHRFQQEIRVLLAE